MTSAKFRWIGVAALADTPTRVGKNGVGLLQAQKLLGQSDPKLTAAVYTHLDTEDLRGAVEGLPALRVAPG